MRAGGSTALYDAIIQSLPDTPENHAAIQALLSLRANTQVIRQPWIFEVDFATGQAFVPPAPGATSIGNFLVDNSVAHNDCEVARAPQQAVSNSRSCAAALGNFKRAVSSPRVKKFR